MLASEIGDAIYRIGAAWHDHDITLTEAIRRIRDAAPELSQFGATLQLKEWRSAPARYRARPELPPAPRGRRPLDAVALRREPITIRFRAAG